MKKFLGCVAVAASLFFAGTAGADPAKSANDQAFLSGLAQPPSAVGLEAQKAKPADICTQTFCQTSQECVNTPACGLGTFCHKGALWGRCDYF
jgi:hypothetical protein